MNTRIAMALAIMLMLLLNACAAPGGAPAAAPAAEAPAAESATEAPAEADSAAAAEEGSTGERVPPEAPVAPNEDKPSLSFTQPIDGIEEPIIGFIFPDGAIAMLAAALAEPVVTSNGFFAVGIIEIGDGATQISPGMYTITIDLQNQERDVGGQLISFESNDAIDLDFHRSPQQLNEAREFDPPPMQVGVTADSVCFYADLGALDTGQTQEPYWRYCAVNDLSVRENFTSTYATLEEQMETTIGRLNELPIFNEANLDPNTIALTMTISELEDWGNIGNCAQARNSENCGADIAGAPSKIYWADFGVAKDAVASEPFHVLVAVTHIYRPIDTSNLGVVQPGDYAVDYWFDADGNFTGATITGITDKEVQIIDQQIPAVAAQFLNQEEEDDLISQISAWRLRSGCCFQRRCP